MMVFVCFHAAMAGIMSVVSIPSTSTHMAPEVTAARRVPGIRWDASTCFSAESSAGFGAEILSPCREACNEYVGYFKLTLILLSVFVRKCG